MWIYILALLVISGPVISFFRRVKQDQAPLYIIGSLLLFVLSSFVISTCLIYVIAINKSPYLHPTVCHLLSTVVSAFILSHILTRMDTNENNSSQNPDVLDEDIPL